MDSSELPPHPLQILQLEITQDSLLKYRPSDDSTYQENDTSSSVPECHAYEYPTSSTDEIRGGETDSGESSLSRALHTLSLEVTSEGVIVNCDSSSTGDVSDHQGVTNHNGTVSRDEECLPSLNKYYGITTPSVSPDKNTMRTEDISNSLDVSRNFKLKWVNDTHVLAIYADSQEALAASKELYAEIDVILLSKSSHNDSLVVARQCGASIRGSLIKKLNKSSEVASKRPPTTASVARRMVGHALGVRITASPEQREKERREVEEVKKQKQSKRGSGFV